jgi:hypothetical protein
MKYFFQHHFEEKNVPLSFNYVKVSITVALCYPFIERWSKLPKQSPVLKFTFFLSYHRKFLMNWTFFKRSTVLKDHFFFLCPKDDLLIQVWLYFLEWNIVKQRQIFIFWLVVSWVCIQDHRILKIVFENGLSSILNEGPGGSMS